MRNIIWRTHDGRRIPIPELENDHLGNCIDMIYRGYDRKGRPVSEKTAKALPHLLAEFKRRRSALSWYENELWC